MTISSKSYPQMRKEFFEKYINIIVPLVQKQEKIRKTKLIIAIVLSILSLILGIFILYTTFALHEELHMSSREGEKSLEAGITFLILPKFIYEMIKKNFENSIKKRIMPSVCNCFGDLKWTQGIYKESSIFSDSQIFCSVPITSKIYDDIFKGTYKGVNIDIVESNFSIGNGKNKSTIFNGVIIKLSMNKPFNCHTLIKPNSLMHTPPSYKLKYTELEDPEFNKIFDVYTNDEITARYLITPSFMQRLKNMEVAFKADNTSCAFYENCLIIALSTKKDLFSLCSLIKPLKETQQYFQMYEEIVSILKLIDHFKLDQKIGL